MKVLIYLSSLSLLLVACNNGVDFRRISYDGKLQTPGEPTPYQEHAQFNYERTRDEFKQEKHDVNKTAVVFKALDNDGRSVAGIDPDDLYVEENGIEVKNYTLRSNDTRDPRGVDIVFALDITGSMDEEINAVKFAIRDFVQKLATKNVNARLCAVTFKDWTFQYCRKFMDTETFLDFLSRLDPEGGDQPKENSLGAIVDAATVTPWDAQNQRVIIPITDIGFWIMPIDRNKEEARHAPTYEQLMTAVKNSHAMVFPITPKMPAFSKNYFQYPSLPKMSGGEWFDLRKLEKGQTTMDDIFEKIGDVITTNYVVEYNVEDNEGLNPTLPLRDRNVEVHLLPTSGASTVQKQSVTSTMPYGRPDYVKRFKLKSGVKSSSLEVYINGERIAEGYSVEGSDLTFSLPPEPGAEIVAYYENKALRDNVKVQSLLLKGVMVQNLKVWLNGIAAPETDYMTSTTNSGETVFDLKNSAFDEKDPYMIRTQGHLRIYLEYESL